MWKETYRSQMFSEQSSNLKLEEAMVLKYKNMPSSLYKYRIVNDYTLNNLLNNTIWFNKAYNFNDPYDCGLTINQELIVSERLKRKLLKEFSEKYDVDVSGIKNLQTMSYRDLLSFFLYYYSEYSNIPEEVPKIVDDYISGFDSLHQRYVEKMNSLYQQSIFIACFSEVNDSILMWSHYASNHSGICIEYDFKQCGENHELTKSLYPVNYSSRIFDMTNYEKNKNAVDISVLAAVTKSKDWSYEKEWRLVFTLNSESGPFNGGIVSPTTIYLGTKINDTDKEKILEIADDNNIPVKQMYLSREEYKLYSETI